MSKRGFYDFKESCVCFVCKLSCGLKPYSLQKCFLSLENRLFNSMEMHEIQFLCFFFFCFDTVIIFYKLIVHLAVLLRKSFHFQFLLLCCQLFMLFLSEFHIVKCYCWIKNLLPTSHSSVQFNMHFNIVLESYCCSSILLHSKSTNGMVLF